jgi:hypothetical protein
LEARRLHPARKKVPVYDSVAQSPAKWMLFHTCKIAIEPGRYTEASILGISADITAARDGKNIFLINQAKTQILENPILFLLAMKAHLIAV